MKYELQKSIFKNEISSLIQLKLTLQTNTRLDYFKCASAQPQLMPNFLFESKRNM